MSYELDTSVANYPTVSRYIVVDPTSGVVSVAELGEGGFIDAEGDEGREIAVGLRVRDNSPEEPGKPGKFVYRYNMK